MSDLSRIRCFSIVAHIDHGKSTLADRLIEVAGTVDQRQMRAQLLDSMDLEREHGITIKASAVRLPYLARDGQEYTLNLIDTPGHVDFSYEVSRALQACEGALLVVDAAQGVEAQTIANYHLALEQGLTILPVINKIDLPAADVPRRLEEIEEILSLPADDAVAISARAKINIDGLLEAIVRHLPPPTGDPDAPLRALIFDSKFDPYRGAVAYVRVVEGTLRARQNIRMMSTGKSFEIGELGVFTPAPTPIQSLGPGDVGYIIANIRTVADTRVGDTVTDAAQPAAEALPGYQPAKPMVFSGLYPVDSNDYHDLREALEKLQLNDAALSFEPETSAALGLGFRAGFLGLLHMQIVQERLEREFNIDLICTAASVIYQILTTDGELHEIHNPANLPDPQRIDQIEEPTVRATIMTPPDYVGPCLDLCQTRRGELLTLEYASPTRTMIVYKLPLAEILHDFFDVLKSRSRGYATLDYELDGSQVADLVKVDLMINGDKVDALSAILHRSVAQDRGRELCDRLRAILPRQQFEIRIQASIGAKILASARVSAFRKDVTAKCYGGDISRKRKLLEKQKEGKRRMKQIGSVEIPQEAFLAVLRSDETSPAGKR
ncbi:MAG: elongation factor 4 [Fimbriimonadaceae bacterium]|nr:elongation factor 4 [Fimbriimonadaceae bacterium]